MAVSVLRRVLDVFEHSHGALSLTQVARELDLDPQMLDVMLEHWVRKGKLRITADSTPDCTSCGGARGCPFAASISSPRSYELVTD